MLSEGQVRPAYSEQGWMRWLERLLWGVAVTMACFHLYVGFTGLIESFLLRLIHLAFAIVILSLQTFIVFGRQHRKLQLVSAVAVLLSTAPIVYILLNYDYFNWGRFPYIDPLSSTAIAIGVIFVLLILVVMWQSLGLVFMLVVAVFLVYPFVGPYLPGFLYHHGYSLGKVVDNLVFTTDGIFGIAIGISATFVVLFIIFGTFMEQAGLANLMARVASGAVGKRRGGPAQAAVAFAGGVGMISGSAVANVLTVGSSMIPTMKRLGYEPEFAGGVQAAASSAGQVTPPVMGAQAFIMSQLTGVPYITICRYSLLPALLYYLGMFFGIDFQARRLKMKGLPPEAIPKDWIKSSLKQAHLLLPLLLLVVLLIVGYTPMFSVTYSIVAMFVVSLFSRATRLLGRRLLTALAGGGLNTVIVATSCAGAGIIVGMATLTNLGATFSRVVVDLAGGSVPLALIFTMFVSIILGMGLPTIPAYIIQIALVIPALLKLGIPLYMAHLFVIYYAALSMITPPVCIAAYAAAGISGAGGMHTGWLASRLAATAYLVPFLFVYHTGLLLIGSPLEILVAIAIAVSASFSLAVGAVGHMVRPVPPWQRILWLAAACLFVPASVMYNCYAGLLMLVLVGLQWLKTKLESPVGAGKLSGISKFL